jgi:hypothetical protein
MTKEYIYFLIITPPFCRCLPSFRAHVLQHIFYLLLDVPTSGSLQFWDQYYNGLPKLYNSSSGRGRHWSLARFWPRLRCFPCAPTPMSTNLPPKMTLFPTEGSDLFLSRGFWEFGTNPITLTIIALMLLLVGYSRPFNNVVGTTNLRQVRGHILKWA